jgi:6-phosphogluconolactonase
LPKEERRRAAIGTISVLPIADGQLKAATCVIHNQGSSIRPAQEGPHPHMMRPSVDGRFVLVTDLGTDQVLIYQLDTSTGQLALNQQGTAVVSENPGACPGHFAFAAGGRTLYGINELNATVTVYDSSPSAASSTRARSSRRYRMALMGRRSGTRARISPSHPTADSSLARIEGMTASPSERSRTRMARCGQSGMSRRGGRHRATSPDSTGAWLLVANQDSDTIDPFRRDPGSGRLTTTGPVTQTRSPVAILFSQV